MTVQAGTPVVFLLHMRGGDDIIGRGPQGVERCFVFLVLLCFHSILQQPTQKAKATHTLPLVQNSFLCLSNEIYVCSICCVSIRIYLPFRPDALEALSLLSILPSDVEGRLSQAGYLSSLGLPHLTLCYIMLCNVISIYH